MWSNFIVLKIPKAEMGEKNIDVIISKIHNTFLPKEIFYVNMCIITKTIF